MPSKFKRVFAANDFGALLCYEVPIVKVLDSNELGQASHIAIA